MSTHVAKLVAAFRALPLDFSESDLGRVIVDTLNGVPLHEWESIAEDATTRYCDEQRDRITLFLANFRGTMQ